MTAYERVMAGLRSGLPRASEEQLKAALKEYRESQVGASLRGFTVAEVVEGVLATNMDEGRGSDEDINAWESTRGDDGLSGSGGGGEGEGGELCPICSEVMRAGGREEQPCGHAFHPDCLATWLALNMSCPVCRTHTVDRAEYPPLK